MPIPTKVEGQIREALARRRRMGRRETQLPVIFATDQELDKLVAELLGIVEAQEKKAHLAHAPTEPERPWWAVHSRDCGTKYRGCAPDCPKDARERQMEVAELEESDDPCGQCRIWKRGDKGRQERLVIRSLDGMGVHNGGGDGPG